MAIVKTLFGWQLSTKCSECGRPLTDPVSVKRGIGPICWAQSLQENNDMQQDTNSTSILIPGIRLESGIILTRHNDGSTMSNVAHVAIHHSPSGFEWGYGGSGPADLALNICEAVLKTLDYKGPRIDLWNGTCFAAAWAMHQDYKSQFIIGIPHEGAVLSWEETADWVQAHTPHDDLLT